MAYEKINYIDTGEIGMEGLIRNIEGLWDEAIPVDQVNIFYVGKHGDDDNGGLNIDDAFLSFGRAIEAARAQDPAADNKFVIRCQDAGVYKEAVSIPSYVAIYGPKCELNGNIEMLDRSALQVFSNHCEHGTAIRKTDGNSHATVFIHRIHLGRECTGVECVRGQININGSIIMVERGGCGIVCSRDGVVNANINHIEIVDDGIGVEDVEEGTINLIVNKITGVEGGTGIRLTDRGIIVAIVTSIECATAYDVRDSHARLNLMASSIVGDQETIAGTTCVVCANCDSEIGGRLKLLSIELTPGIAPLNPEEGDLYMDAASHRLRCYNGSTWLNCC